MKIYSYISVVIFTASMISGCGARRTPAAPVSVPVAVTDKAPLAQTAFMFPIAEGTLPQNSELLPGAPRDYRGGVHEGVDVYYKSGTSMVPCNEPVLNCAEGWVIRADTDWKPMTEKEYYSDTQRLKKEHDEILLDRLRGRQIWVRTAEGITIRYCHLASVAPGILAGIKVSPGVVIGAVGNTGTADGAKITARNCHLHLEIWMPDGKFLGDGLSPRSTRDAWSRLFGLSPAIK